MRSSSHLPRPAAAILRTAIVAAISLIASSCVWVGWVGSNSGGSFNSNGWVTIDLSGDGRYLLIFTNDDLVPLDTNGRFDIYRYDVRDDVLEIVSVSTGNVNGNGDSLDAEISDDGNLVVFSSTSDNLVAGDTGPSRDIFLRDVSAGVTTRQNVVGATESNNSSANPAISSDGRAIAWDSRSTSLVAGDTNGSRDVFVQTISTGAITLVSRTATGVIGNGDSERPSLDYDGNVVGFESAATNLVGGDTNGNKDVFLKLTSGYIERVSVTQAGAQGNGDSEQIKVSGNGAAAAFRSLATNFFANDTNGDFDIIHRDVALGTTLWASVPPSGLQGFLATNPAINFDGSLVGWQGSTAGAAFVRDIFGAAVSDVATVDTDGNTVYVDRPVFSGDFRYVGARTNEALDAADTNGTLDAYVWAWRDPTPTSVAPSSIDAGDSVLVTITGSGFETGATVLHGTGLLTFTDVLVVNDTTMTAKMTAAPGTPPAATQFIFVRNPDGGPGPDRAGAGWCQCVDVLP